MDTHFVKVLRIGVLASGNGTNFEALAKAILVRKLPLKIVLLVVNNPECRARQRAERLGIPFKVIDHRCFDSKNTFENTINALENSGELLSKVSRVFYNLLSAHSNDNLNKIASEISPKLSRHNDSISLNQDLFIKIKKVHEDKDLLNDEQQRLVQIIFDNFKLRGSLLDDGNREVLKSMNEKLSSLSLKFNQNTLKETNNFQLIISDPNELDGLPEDLILSLIHISETTRPY